MSREDEVALLRERVSFLEYLLDSYNREMISLEREVYRLRNRSLWSRVMNK